MTVKKILITGISGLVGSSAYLRLVKQPDKYQVYGLGRRRVLSERVPEGRSVDLPEERFFLADIAARDQVAAAVEGMDVVVHMAADPAGRSWDSLLHNNLIGAYNIFEACRLAGVGRVVAASTIQVSTGQRQQQPYRGVAESRGRKVPADFVALSAAVPAEPRNLYGASKVWAESLCRVYAHTHGISCLALRIGWVVAEDKPRNPESAADIWCSQRDIAQLIEACICAPPELKFDIFYGMSDNAGRWVDIEGATRRVGYVPQDRAEDHY